MRIVDNHGVLRYVVSLFRNVTDEQLLAELQAASATLRKLERVSKAALSHFSLRDLVPESVRWSPRLEPEAVAAAMDEAWALVLPSRSEGMGRVLVEAFCRGRGVVGTRAGSIPDLVEDGRSGLLVDPGDPRALADAIVRVLSDRLLAESLGAAARESAASWLQTPEEYAARMRALVE